MPNTELKLERSCTMCGDADDVIVLDLCRNCYAYCYYWNKKTLAAKLERVKNLKKYELRMSIITGSGGRHLKEVPKRRSH